MYGRAWSMTFNLLKGFFKGTVSRDFLLLVLFMNQFPPAPEYSIKTVSNFFENLRRYSQLKVCHRCQQHWWQMEKIFNQNNFNNFVWSPLGSRGNLYIKFCLQVHFQVSAAWYCSHYLPPVSITPVANLQPVSFIPAAICHRCHWHRWQICHRCRWHRWCTLTCEYLREFLKKFEMILRLLSGTWGKVIHEKKPEAKNLVTLSL